MVDRPVAGRLLGAHVAERAEQLARTRQADVRLRRGKAEVGHQNVALVIDEQVGRLHIAVHHAPLVGEMQRGRGLAADLGDSAVEAGPPR